MAEPVRRTDFGKEERGYNPEVVRPLEPAGASVTQVEVEKDLERTRDAARWGPILAGTVTLLSTLVILGLLGLAVGLAAYDANDRLADFGIGAGWWGAVSAVLAFLAGGFIAGCSAALVRGKAHGMLNGFLVWAVAIPLMLVALSSGVSTALRTTATAAGSAAGQAIAGGGAATQVANLQNQATGAVTGAQVEQAVTGASTGAWWTLAILLLCLAASAVGGFAGGRSVEKRHDQSRRIHTVAT